ncbi:MAG: 50S ribosomal protein L13 [Candidatus Methanoperedens sp.]|jgi:large subunit ribosomal protein L13|nr:50S ribosomal protein L13 [Candidatus Methanoperedens sp.]PKL53506.1 MAG: 50S ribosomal protein L13 [Candidatus Methanoperedenaceae archaeon HGW-Methanoperedenaceae-1]
MTVIDANNLILGRLASDVAKRLLNGEVINIVNAEKTIISGRKVATFDRYKQYASRGRDFGPYFPKRPDQIVKRTVRGMIPYKRERGKEAFKNLKVYIGVPRELSEQETTTIERASISRLSTSKYTVLGELSKKLGSKV